MDRVSPLRLVALDGALLERCKPAKQPAGKIDTSQHVIRSAEMAAAAAADASDIINRLAQAIAENDVVVIRSLIRIASAEAGVARTMTANILSQLEPGPKRRRKS
jgi:HPt (histidine-containing phosphotransfer) domain-containing protein